MDTKHTATPWHKRETYSDADGVFIENEHEVRVAIVLKPEDADRIVRACNAHDDLVKALRRLVFAADELTDGQIDPNAGSSEREFIAAHEASRALLAKVEA